MTEDINAPAADRQARLAGLLGLGILISGTIAGSVSRTLVVPQDAAATAQHLLASAPLFRLGMASGLVMYTLFIFYALVL